MRGRGVIVTAAALGLVLAACGGGGSGSDSAKESAKSAADILADAKKTATAARSVHVISSGTDKPLNVVLTKSGQAAGLITLQDGKTAEIIVISDEVVYARTPKTKGKYGKLAAADAHEVAANLTMKSLIEEGLSPEGTVKKGKTTTLEGKKVIELLDEPAGDQLYVTDSPHPYPLKAVQKKGGSTTFTEWDKSVTLKDPAKQKT